MTRGEPMKEPISATAMYQTHITQKELDTATRNHVGLNATSISANDQRRGGEGPCKTDHGRRKETRGKSI